jgi:hypothetical protein
MKPRLAKPRIIIAQVDGSGTGDTSFVVESYVNRPPLLSIRSTVNGLPGGSTIKKNALLEAPGPMSVPRDVEVVLRYSSSVLFELGLKRKAFQVGNVVVGVFANGFNAAKPQA